MEVLKTVDPHNFELSDIEGFLSEIVEGGYKPERLKACRDFHATFSFKIMSGYYAIFPKEEKSLLNKAVSRWVSPFGTVELDILDVDVLNEIVLVCRKAD